MTWQRSYLTCKNKIQQQQKHKFKYEYKIQNLWAKERKIMTWKRGRGWQLPHVQKQNTENEIQNTVQRAWEVWNRLCQQMTWLAREGAVGTTAPCVNNLHDQGTSSQWSFLSFYIFSLSPGGHPHPLQGQNLKMYVQILQLQLDRQGLRFSILPEPNMSSSFIRTMQLNADDDGGDYY